MHYSNHSGQTFQGNKNKYQKHNIFTFVDSSLPTQKNKLMVVNFKLITSTGILLIKMAFEDSVTRSWFKDILYVYALKYFAQKFAISERCFFPTSYSCGNCHKLFLNPGIMYNKIQMAHPTMKDFFVLFCFYGSYTNTLLHSTYLSSCCGKSIQG